MSVQLRRRGVVAVIERDSRLLVIRRSELVVAPGAFCFPGGGIEAGETEEQALVRELEEELAVRVRPLGRLWQSVTPWHVELAWWLTHLPRHAVLVPHPAEIASVHWFSADELKKLPGLLESNQQFLERLASGEISLARPVENAD